MSYDILCRFCRTACSRCRGGDTSSWRSILTHVTIASVTIFLHRAQAHRGLDLHPVDQPFLPLLAVAHHRDGHQGMGGDPSQAPREGAKPTTTRTARRRAASTTVLLAGRRAVSRPSRRTAETLEQVRPRHARRLDRAQRLRALLLARRRPDAGRQSDAVRPDRRDDLGGADDVDPDHRRRRHQRPRPLLGLPQLRLRRTRRRTSCRGAS